ncbi:MAG: hypothetical protein GX555_13315 [Actinomycetales bacterium]|nr:hypothetical protein [Actinomycetales bacterium]
MRSVLLVGAGVAAGLTVLAIIGAVLEWWWLPTAAAMLLLSGAFLAAIDSDRRVRSLRAQVRREVRRAGGVSHKAAGPTHVAPPVTDLDVTGAVQLLQAQYTGRLDRMQEALDQAVAQLRAESHPAPSAAANERA